MRETNMMISFQGDQVRRTVECGNQTNFQDTSTINNNNNFNILEKHQKRKIKRKEYKKRRKNKEIQFQNELKNQLYDIVDSIYSKRKKFIHLQQRVYQLICIMPDSCFRQLLNNQIRQQVNKMQTQFWQFIQSILQQNPFSKGSNCIFYCLMINQIYQKYQNIEESSYEIQKMINLHLKHTFYTEGDSQEFIHQNLAKNTFNYMVSTDESFKNLIYLCQQKIPYDKAERQKIQFIMQILQSMSQFHEEYQDENNYMDERSTSIQQDQQQNICYYRRKKRRRKIKQNDLNCQFEDVMQRLNSLNINKEQQIQCQIQQSWIEKMQRKLVQFKKNNRNKQIRKSIQYKKQII